MRKKVKNVPNLKLSLDSGYAYSPTMITDKIVPATVAMIVFL